MPRDYRGGPVVVPGCAIQFDNLRSEEHTSELQSRQYLVCGLLLEKKEPPTCAMLDRVCQFHPLQLRLRAHPDQVRIFPAEQARVSTSEHPVGIWRRVAPRHPAAL